MINILKISKRIYKINKIENSIILVDNKYISTMYGCYLNNALQSKNKCKSEWRKKQ